MFPLNRPSVFDSKAREAYSADSHSSYHKSNLHDAIFDMTEEKNGDCMQESTILTQKSLDYSFAF